MTFRAIKDVGSLPWIDTEICGLFFLAIGNSYRQTFPYSSIHVDHTQKLSWLLGLAITTQTKQSSKTTVNTAKIWDKNEAYFDTYRTKF